VCAAAFECGALLRQYITLNTNHEVHTMIINILAGHMCGVKAALLSIFLVLVFTLYYKVFSPTETQRDRLWNIRVRV
jgi:hypothetical protein